VRAEIQRRLQRLRCCLGAAPAPRVARTAGAAAHTHHVRSPPKVRKGDRPPATLSLPIELLPAHAAGASAIALLAAMGRCNVGTWSSRCGQIDFLNSVFFFFFFFFF
jgi:hypothetical protein